MRTHDGLYFIKAAPLPFQTASISIWDAVAVLCAWEGSKLFERSWAPAVETVIQNTRSESALMPSAAPPKGESGSRSAVSLLVAFPALFLPPSLVQAGSPRAVAMRHVTQMAES